MLKKIISAMLALALIVGMGAASAFAESAELPEGVSPLPIDLSPGMVVDPANYASDILYEDPSLRIAIETGREDNCDYWIAHIRIADPSQLRTASAGGFNSSAAMSGTGLARRVNAVLAIDGDYFCYTGKGYILRQGEVYLNALSGDRDVLLIDANGDFHTLYKPEADSIGTEIDGVPIVNAFFFGPILVDNGEAIPDVWGQNMAAEERRQRMCLAQVGPLEYKAICCAAPARGSYGMTLQQFANFVARQGVQIAYNLDGGDSTMLIFNGQKLNDVRNPNTRKICDIIYFASAYDAPGVIIK